MAHYRGYKRSPQAVFRDRTSVPVPGNCEAATEGAAQRHLRETTDAGALKNPLHSAKVVRKASVNFSVLIERGIQLPPKGSECSLKVLCVQAHLDSSQFAICT